SNVLAGKLFGIPVSGTHSHSWVMAFQSELEAFEAYAEVMPGNCVLLVDTYNTLEGVRKAVKVGLDLKEKGKKLKAIRVDSGDLAYLSIEARKILDVAGLKDTQIVGSNDLDEYLIASLKDQGASITMWGVGTKLITSFDQPALGQVYKMTAIKNKDGEWENRIKLSEQNIKINMPGILNVRRFFVNGKMAGDMIFDERDKMDDFRIIAPDDFTKRKKFGMDTQYEDLLKPIFEQGNQSYKVPSIEESRQYHLKQRNMLDASSRRLVNPHLYPVGLEPKLFERRSELIIKLRNK
ncbi:MAG: nicotinate phosphoribosyltransferase, partial [Cyclobacteriaceae bacterium]